jgi:hypothetical protein
MSLVGELVEASFPNVKKNKFEDMAKFVGLYPRLELDDIRTFNLHRSRIPTNLFRSIVEDMVGSSPSGISDILHNVISCA